MRATIYYLFLTDVLSTILLWNILLYVHSCEPQYCLWLLMYADNNVCWVLYCYEIFYHIVPMRATILSDDYWHMLTIMSVEYNILLWNILRYCTHVSHNIVCWVLTYSHNIVCWILYCYEIFYYIVHSCMPQYCLLTTERMLTIMYVECHIALNILLYCLFMRATKYCLLTTERMLTIMSVEYHIAMKYFYDIVPMRATILSDDYWRMLTILSVEYYCYEIFYFWLINYYTTVLLLSFKPTIAVLR
jgi:hypothetical protein